MGSERIRPAAGLVRAVLDLSDAFRRRLRGQRSSLRSSYEHQLIRFLDNVRTGTVPRPGIDDGVAVIRLGVYAEQRFIIHAGPQAHVFDQPKRHFL